MKVAKKVARKDYQKDDIKKGDTYFKWTPYRQAPRRSKVPPTRAQLAGAVGMSSFYTAIDESLPVVTSADDLRDVAQQVRDAAQEATDAFDNLPEGLQQTEGGQRLETRADEMTTFADTIDEKADELDAFDPEEEINVDDAVPAEGETAETMVERLKEAATSDKLNEIIAELQGEEPSIE